MKCAGIPSVLVSFLLLAVSYRAAAEHQGGLLTQATQPDSLGVVLPDTVFLGNVIVAGIDSVAIPLLNSATVPIILDTAYLDPSLGTFDLVARQGELIVPDSMTRLMLRFHPIEPGCRATVLYVSIRRTDGRGKVYRIGVAGCGGKPILRINRFSIDFGSIRVGDGSRVDSLAISNAGDFPLTVSAISTSMPMYQLAQHDPFVLLPGSFHVVHVTFAPIGPGTFLDTLSIVSNSLDPVPPFSLAGTAYIRSMDLPEMIDWGSVKFGECHDTTLSVRNTGTVPITLRAIRLVSGDQRFTLTSDAGNTFPRTIVPDETAYVTLRFCALEHGRASDTVELEDSDGALYRVRLDGEGLSPRVWLDTVQAVAGDHLWLSLHLDSGFAHARPPGPYSFELHVDPFALFPSGRIEAPGASGAVVHAPDGTITITGDNFGMPHQDGVLLRIQFRGLSTGQAENRVELRNILFGSIGSGTVAGDGLVKLSGYGDEELYVERRMRIVGMRSDGDGIEVAYRAASGRAPLLRLFDGRGGQVERVSLGLTTGADEVVTIATGHYPRGWYVLELREGDDVVTMPVMLTN
jgi:hypothetical protein